MHFSVDASCLSRCILMLMPIPMHFSVDDYPDAYPDAFRCILVLMSVPMHISVDDYPDADHDAF